MGFTAPAPEEEKETRLVRVEGGFHDHLALRSLHMKGGRYFFFHFVHAKIGIWGEG